ncbi:MAG TPA: serine hydrolase domain-containing protein [Thermoanaerobaculia bacterium]
MTRWIHAAAGWMVLMIVVPAMAQPSPAIRARIDSLVAAFNDSPEAFEAYALAAYTPEALAKSDTARRARTHGIVRKDFGRLSVGGVKRTSETSLEIGVEGSTGERGAILVDVETAPPHRITSLAFRIGGPDEENGPALPPVPIRASMPMEELSKKLDTYVAALASEGRFSGTLLVARDGKLVFERAWGLANRADEVANTPRTRHNLGSINKQFTRAAIGQLAAAGKLALDDPLGKYLPDHAQADARKATITQLLDHTAGLGDFFGPDFQKAEKSAFRTNSDYYAFVAPRPLTFPPGSRRQYCNACYITLGEIVTRVSGMPYEKYVEERIFRPAEMKDAGFFQIDHVVPRIALGYAETPNGLRNNLYARGAAGSAAGGAFATAADLLALDNALRDGKLLDAKWTGWFFGDDRPASGRASAATSYAGGSFGINAGVSGNGQWTVIAMANISPPAAEALSEAVLRALIAQ